jgi:hypothetical protein
LFTLQSSADDVAKGSQSCVAQVLFVFQNRFMPAPAGPGRYAGGRRRKKAGDKKNRCRIKQAKCRLFFLSSRQFFRHSLSERPEVGTAEKE